MARRPNRLANARSPYLRQHAYNPVDWYPWGPEALERARREDKPIFLSIGYSACHWCHVMERESFEHEELARLLNEHFVPIKVDREERPDLDMIYQRAAQLAGVPGGWPLSVFLTPDLKPFWVGTYIPPEDRWGRAGFGRVLRTLAAMWREQRSEVERVAERLAAAVAQVDAPPEPRAAVDVPGGGEEDGRLLRAAAARLLRHVDWRHGGFGSAPKFPNPSALQLLLRAARRARPGDELGTACRLALLLTLRRMASGGIYDQLGGGFHRYAVDEAWRVPHFEKMLYDNAQLIPLYLEASLLVDDPRLAGRFRQVARETIAYVARELVAPGGGFYSAQDADSEGEEGRYFTWTPAELEAALGAEDARLAVEHFGVTEAGNFERGRSVLQVAVPVEELAARHGLSERAMGERLDAIRRRLLEARARRVQPATDDKVLAGWNGLMIGGLARAALLTGEEEPLALARGAADFLLARLCRPDGHLYRAAKDGEPYQDGFLEDYAFTVAGLLELYQATFEGRYLEAALRLTDAALDRFWDEEQGGFFFTPRDGEPLPYRPRDATDSAIPSPTAVMALNLLLLEPFRGDGRCLRRAEAVLRAYRPLMVEHPLAASTLVLAYDTYVHGPVEVALAGADDGVLRDWARAAARLLVPGCLLTRVPAEAAGAPDAPPIWAGRVPVGGGPTAYVCRDRTCSLPLKDREALERELARALG